MAILIRILFMTSLRINYNVSKIDERLNTGVLVD